MVTQILGTLAPVPQEPTGPNQCGEVSMFTQIPALARHLSKDAFRNHVCQIGSHNRETTPRTVILPKNFSFVIFCFYLTFNSLKRTKKYKMILNSIFIKIRNSFQLKIKSAIIALKLPKQRQSQRCKNNAS